MRTRLMLVGVVAVILLAVWGVISLRNSWRSHGPEQASKAGAPPSASSNTSLAPSAPIHGQMPLVAEILKQGLTPERAKLLFSMVVGPLPGVTVPPGSGDRYDFDGTLAVTYIYEVWDSLTDEQRAAATRLIHHPGNPPQPAADWFSPTGTGLSLIPPAQAFDTANTAVYDYEQLAIEANSMIAGTLQIPAVSFTLSIDNDPPQGDEYAHTWSWYLYKYIWGSKQWKDLPGGCEISVHNQKFVGVNPVDAQSIMDHEMFHCYQQRAAGSGEAMLGVGKWISEGEATWVMFDLVNGADVGDYLLGGIWKWYVLEPETTYSQRSYDAVGVFGHLGDLAGDGAVWAKLLPVVQAGVGGKNSEAFNLLVAGHQDDYYTSWGSSYFEVSGNQPWTMVGPGPVLTKGPDPQTVSIDPQYNETLPPAAHHTSELFQLSGSADIATVSILTGYGRLHDQNFSLDTPLYSTAPLALCLKQGGCKCPDGSPGASLFTKQVTTPLSIGLNGGETTGQVAVVGDSLDSFCKEPDKNPAPAPGGGGGGGGGGGTPDNSSSPTPPPPPEGTTWGDTHIATFDGLGYDFQVVGEYTLVRSTKDDFLVEVRQVPVLGPKIASVNQAIATRIGGQRLTFAMENGALVLRIDGKVVSGAPPRLKVGSLSGATTAYGGAFQLTWPDGTSLHVQQLGSYAIDAKVQPAASRRGTLTGLLGDFNGTPDNDLIGKNKSKVAVTRDDINQNLASAWRVTKSNSLFDYNPGQSPASFVDPNFPAKDAAAARLANHDAAEKVCRAHGITDQRLLDDCILDLAVTNSFVFGSQYAHAQHVLSARAALAQPTTAAAALPLLWVDGQILDSSSEPEYRFQGKQGDVIWVGYDPNCKQVGTPDAYPAMFDLMDPSGKQINWKTPCDFGRFELPVTGTYTFKVRFKYRGDTVHYHVPVQFVRPDRKKEIHYGDLASGSIEQWAAHDVYTWTAKEGDLIVLSGEGCKLPYHTSIIDAEGNDFMGPDCREGTFWKVPKDGTYQLVVNGGEWTHGAVTGPYSFVFQGGKLAK